MNITTNFIIPTGFTLAMFSIDKLFNRKLSFWFYVSVFFLFSIFGSLHAESEKEIEWEDIFKEVIQQSDKDIDEIYSLNIDILEETEYVTTAINSRKQMLLRQMQQYYAMAQQHYQNGLSHIRQAESLSVLLPNTSDYNEAKKMISSFMGSLGCGTPASRLVTMIIIFGTQHLLDSYDTWRQIKSHLDQAEYAFKQSEWYIMLYKDRYNQFLRMR